MAVRREEDAMLEELGCRDRTDEVELVRYLDDDLVLNAEMVEDELLPGTLLGLGSGWVAQRQCRWQWSSKSACRVDSGCEYEG